jgi:nucleotide-binding universal stress UspA family protein
MFDTILWATDGSSRCDRSLVRVREMCEEYGSSLRVVHVVPEFGLGRISADVHPHEDRTIAKLKAQTSALRRHGINASLHVIRGAHGCRARHIADTARMIDAQLIIVATRGRLPLAEAIHRDVTQQLLTRSPCPVFVVPSGTTRPVSLRTSPRTRPRPRSDARRDSA